MDLQISSPENKGTKSPQPQRDLAIGDEFPDRASLGTAVKTIFQNQKRGCYVATKKVIRNGKPYNSHSSKVIWCCNGSKNPKENSKRKHCNMYRGDLNCLPEEANIPGSGSMGGPATAITSPKYPDVTPLPFARSDGNMVGS
jgi:hypothetical protein